MPTPVEIKPEELKLLQELVETQLGFLLKDTYDCQRAAEKMHAQGITTSYNSLRRIFGLVPSTHKPSRHLLNSLCKFASIPSWDQFQAYTQTRDNEEFSQMLHIYYRYEFFDPKKLALFTPPDAWSHWEFVFKYRNLVEAAVQKQDGELLDTLLNFPLDLNDVASIEKAYVALEPLYMALRGNPAFWLPLVERWIDDSATVRRILLEFYVDENSLDSYYGRLMSRDYPQNSDSFRVFQRLILIQKAWFHEGQKQAIRLWKEWDHQDIDYTFHPIPWARYAAWALKINRNKEPYLQFWRTTDNLWQQMAFANFFFRVSSLLDNDAHELWVDLPVRALSAPFKLFDSSNLHGYLTHAAWRKAKQEKWADVQTLLDQIDIYRIVNDNFEWYYRRYQKTREALNAHLGLDTIPAPSPPQLRAPRFQERQMPAGEQPTLRNRG